MPRAAKVAVAVARRGGEGGREGDEIFCGSRAVVLLSARLVPIPPRFIPTPRGAVSPCVALRCVARRLIVSSRLAPLSSRRDISSCERGNDPGSNLQASRLRSYPHRVLSLHVGPGEPGPHPQHGLCDDNIGCCGNNEENESTVMCEGDKVDLVE
uniref:Uncharacterized protein n=1 Tax=Oryza glumipatula TaxID=40148 RepID=A0A0D9Z2S8_9ORYZ